MPDSEAGPPVYRRFDHGTETKLAFLSQPAAYADRPSRVECVETHMAWVFLTDRHAFKLKKPVRYDFLDFSTLEARHEDCAREVALNRRLASDVYLEMVPLTVDAEGLLTLGGTGRAVDWLVKMQRLPLDRMLDWRLRHASPTAAELRPAALLLAQFYRSARPLDVAPQIYLQNQRDAVHDHVAALNLSALGLPTNMVGEVAGSQLTFLDENAELVRERASRGHIVEGHGDLRPEHICLIDPPVIIDCIEFNRQFRIVDPVAEFAFLTLECQMLGKAWVGELFLRAYSDVSGDQPETRLFDFYKSQWALLRAKLALWHLRDYKGPGSGQWLSRTSQYLKLASLFSSRALAH